MTYEMQKGIVVFVEDSELVFEAVLKDGHLTKE